jgi:hypothetical protein
MVLLPVKKAESCMYHQSLKAKYTMLVTFWEEIERLFLMPVKMEHADCPGRLLN